MADVLEDFTDRLKALIGDWSKYTVIGSFLLYVSGYLALRFHLTALGVGTDLDVLDERYLFTGARCFVYLVSTVPTIVLFALPVAALIYAVNGVLPAKAHAKLSARLMQQGRLTVTGIVFSVLMIQFVMRQCFALSNLLLASKLPAQPAWLVRRLLDERLMTVYFTELIAGSLVPVAILWALHTMPARTALETFARGLLIFLATLQLLLLPINYGYLVIDKSLARLASLGGQPLAAGEEAWLVWEGKECVTFLLRSTQQKSRRLVTLPRGDVKKTEIVAFDKILPTLFPGQ